jgi:hypothetical protein
MGWWWTRPLAGAAVVVIMTGTALAQFGGLRGRFLPRKNIGYDGRFTFVRLNYTTAPGGYFYRGEPAWAHFNTDISQFWEWSGTGLRPIADTNESYKLGVNYIIYGMTH